MNGFEVKAPRSKWTVVCRKADGSIRWTEKFENLVTDEGINDLLAVYFKGAAYTAAWYVGLINGGGAFVGTDTMAAHPGWTENINYAAAGRPSLVLGAVGNKSVDNTAAQANFTINVASQTIAGAFLATNSVKNGVLGKLYAEAAFGSGNKVAEIGDVLTVSVTLTGA